MKFAINANAISKETQTYNAKTAPGRRAVFSSVGGTNYYYRKRTTERITAAVYLYITACFRFGIPGRRFYVDTGGIFYEYRGNAAATDVE